MNTLQLAIAWTGLVITSLGLAAEVDLTVPDTQAPAFREIVSRYTAARSAAQVQHSVIMSRHIKKYLDDAEGMLAEKKKARNTTGIAIASTAKGIFEAALSNLTATGAFEIPAKARRELESTIAEFNTGRTLLENSLTAKESALFKQYSAEFAALVVVLSPGLKGPEARKKIDERFTAMVEDKMPSSATAQVTAAPSASRENSPASGGDAVTRSDGEVASAPGGTGTNTSGVEAQTSILEESGPASSWITAGTFTASIYHMEVLDLSLAEMHPGTNVLNQYNPPTETTTEMIYHAVHTNISNPAMVYRLKRIPNFSGVTVVDWPKASNGFLLTVRTSRPEKIPCIVGFELQVAIPGKEVANTMSTPGGAARSRPEVAKRNINLTIKSTPPHATVYIDSLPVPNTFTPCTIPVATGPHSFRLSLPGYKDLSVPSYVFTVDRQINWTFKPDARPLR